MFCKSQRDQEILKCVLGIDCIQHSFAQVGKAFKLSPTRIGHIVSTATRRICHGIDRMGRTSELNPPRDIW